MRAAKLIIVVAICFALVGQLRAALTGENDSSGSNNAAADEEEDKRNREAWLQFRQQFNKSYSTPGEESSRFTRFVRTFREIVAHNALTDSSFTMSLNPFADYYDQELANLMGLRVDSASVESLRMDPRAEAVGGAQPSVDATPASVDWRKKSGRVSGVKDQGQCGSCWAFSTVALLEGRDDSNETLSEQQLVDCSPNNGGCDGGWMATAIDDLRSQNAGMQTGATYPYTQRQDSCRYDSSRAVTGTPGSPKMLPRGDEKELAKWVANWGPVAVAYQASSAFQSYGGGVFSSSSGCNADDVNHAVTIVGYGRDRRSGMDYWIVKNSWSEQWGEKGFARIRRGVNLCNIASYPLVLN